MVMVVGDIGYSRNANLPNGERSATPGISEKERDPILNKIFCIYHTVRSESNL